MKNKEKYNLKLVEIDLSRGHFHEHPDIDTKHYFIADFGCGLQIGKFSRQWYGYNFNCGGSGMQFDTPGTNASGWTRLWMVIRLKAK